MMETNDLIRELSTRIVEHWQRNWQGTNQPPTEELLTNVQDTLVELFNSQASLMVSTFGGAAQTPRILGPGAEQSLAILFDALPTVMTSVCRVMCTQRTVAIVKCSQCGAAMEQHFDTMNGARKALAEAALCPACLEAGEVMQ